MANPAAMIGDRGRLALFLLAHALMLTAFALLTRGIGPLHHDMTEAFAWGQEFQAGYHKHPPLFAWIVGCWFKVFPHTDWAFYLLSGVNAAAGLAGVWALGGLFLDSRARWFALLLLVLTPFYSLHAITFNANAALLALWPWTAYFLVRSLETRSLRDGALAGLFAGLAMLTKYFSVVLLGAGLVAVLLHPNVRAYFRSPAPYAAMAAGFAIMAPHLVWLVTGDGATLAYAIQKTAFPPGDVRLRAFGTLASVLGSCALAAGLFAVVFRARTGAVLHAAWRASFGRQTAWITALAFGPIALAFALVPLANVRITLPFLIPALFMMTLAPLALSRAEIPAGRVRIAALAVAGLWALLIAIGIGQRATGLGLLDFAPDDVRRETALRANALWREISAAPLRFVGGDEVMAKAATFYAPDQPHYVSLDAPAFTPWAVENLVAAHGMVTICRTADRACMQLAARQPQLSRTIIEMIHVPKRSATVEVAYHIVRPLTR